MNILQPTRKGRFWDLGDWKKQYQALQMQPKEAAEWIRGGDVVTMSAAGNWPYAMDEALTDRLQKTGGHIEVRTLNVMLDTKLFADENAGLAGLHSNFYFPGERKLAAAGRADFVPTHLSATDAWIRTCSPRVAIIACSSPNEQGWMSRSIWGAEVHRNVLEQAEVVIVEVNDQLPFFPSDGDGHMLFHVSEADAIIENSHTPMENPPAQGDELDRTIAGHIAELVSDGCCMQFGLGGLANAVGECLAYAGKKDLGIHTEVLSNCVVELMKKGVINNSRKQICPGRTVGTYFVGDRRLWEFARENPLFCQKEIDWTNDARRIAQNDNVVSVNNAMEIDLTGQVNAETVGARQYSGTGGQLEWVLGAQWSRGGKSILALRSSYLDRNGERRSKIVPRLAPGSIVTTPRTCVQYVATEYGVVDLRYKSLRERARALISIAHPDFRAELSRRAGL